MRPLTERQMLQLTVFTALVCTVFTLLTTGDLLTTVLSIPVSAAAAFWSLRITRRLTRRWVREPAPPPATPHAAPGPPLASPPGVLRRRRERRRPRGRRGVE